MKSSPRFGFGPRRRNRLLGLTTRMATHRWPQSLSLALAGVVLAAPIVGLSAMHQSGVDAIKDSVRAEFGYAQGWKLQATKAAAPSVAGAADVTAVRVGSATVATPSARTDAMIWSIDNAKAPLGLLFQGRRAEVNGEASISRHLADTLTVKVGSSITLSHSEEGQTKVRVVGITSDPADRNADLVISVEPQNVVAGGATYWIVPSVSQELDFTPGVTASGAAGATETRLEHPPGSLSALGGAIPITAMLSVLVMLAAVAVQVPRMRRDIVALQAAGMAPARAWRIATTWIAICVSVGAAVGAVLTLSAVWTFDDPISGAFGQRWTGISLPVAPLVLVLLLPLLMSIAPVRIVEALFAWVRREDRRTQGTGRWTTISGIVLAVAGLILLSLGLLGSSAKVNVDHPEVLGLLGILSLALGIRVGADRFVGVGLGRASSQLVRRLARQLTVGTSIALLVGVACAGYSAWHTHNTNALERINVAPQEPGSYLIYEAPASAAQKILARYRTAGGERSFVYDLPDESLSSIRVTSPAVVRCLKDVPVSEELLDSCLRSQNGIMSIPALDPDLPASDVLVEQKLLDSAGQVGIIAFGPEGGEITRTGFIAGAGSQELGGNMPGIVVSPTSPLATKYNLKPSGLVQLGMLGFGKIDVKDAAQIRGLVASYAPAAQANDSTSVSSSEEGLALSVLVALVGAVLALIIQLTTCIAMVSGAHQTRIAVAAMGIAPAQRTTMCMRVTGPAILGILASAVLVVTIAPQLGYHVPASIGWAWSLPFLAQMIALVMLGGALLRSPRQ